MTCRERRVVVDDQSLRVEAGQVTCWATGTVNHIHLFYSHRFHCKLYIMDEEYDVSPILARQRLELTYTLTGYRSCAYDPWALL